MIDVINIIYVLDADHAWKFNPVRKLYSSLCNIILTYRYFLLNTYFWGCSEFGGFSYDYYFYTRK